MVRSYDRSMFNFFKKLTNISQKLYHFTFIPAMYESQCVICPKLLQAPGEKKSHIGIICSVLKNFFSYL